MSKVEYDGSNYCGFQIQPNGTSIQQTIQEALSRLTGETIRVTGSGRTDAGVHATGQVIHFDTDSPIPAPSMPHALASYLPKDIALTECREVSEAFHARYSALNKTYVYKVCLSKTNRPLMRGRRYIVNYDLDIENMRSAADILLGEHDFAGFMSAGGGAKTTVRFLSELTIAHSGDLIDFTLSANGFLYNMVRIMVGTLIDVGRGHLSVERVGRALDNADRNLSGHTAPPCGLYLTQVTYPDDLLDPSYPYIKTDS